MRGNGTRMHGRIGQAGLNALVFNPGSNSLKVGIVRCRSNQRSASEGVKLVELIVEGIGKEAKLSVYQGKKTVGTEAVSASNFEEAAASALDWLNNKSNTRESPWKLSETDCICVRVVHGGWKFTEPVEMTA